MQTTLLGLAIAFILALVAALVGPYFVDWNQFRPQFEAEATKIIGGAGPRRRQSRRAPAACTLAAVENRHRRRRQRRHGQGPRRRSRRRVQPELADARRMARDRAHHQRRVAGSRLRLDPKGRVDRPASSGTFNFALAGDRSPQSDRSRPLHDAASRSTLELNDIAFSGDVRSPRRRDPRRRQFHVRRQPLPVPDLVGAKRRRQRLPGCTSTSIPGSGRCRPISMAS